MAGDRTVAVRCAWPEGPLLRGPARLLFGERLDPNRAEAAHLEALPGIGPARAAAIVAERCRRPFAHPGEMVRVRGIGARTAQRLEPSLSVELPPRARCEGIEIR